MNDLAVGLTKSQQNNAISTETAELITAGVADNTLRAYRRATRQLETWLDGETLNDGRLAAYITELHQSSKSPSTIAQVVAAVKWQAKNVGIAVVGPITDRTLAGIRRDGKTRGRGQVDGLTWQSVERVCAFAEAEKTIAGLRDSAMIRLMSDCLLRVSEVVAVDVSHLQKNTLTLLESKTDQEGEGVTLYVGDDTLRVIRRYRRRTGTNEGALFRRLHRSSKSATNRLTDKSARRIIKARAAKAGVEGFISGHSLRVGSAVSLAQAGASVVDMQTAGRWESADMPAHYARAELAERGAIARFKYNK